MNAFKRTDLPEPVVPAIKTWGILARSAITVVPETSSPKATANLDLLVRIDSSIRALFKDTISGLRLGISTPTSDFPGIGASILTLPVEVASASAKSF